MCGVDLQAWCGVGGGAEGGCTEVCVWGTVASIGVPREGGDVRDDSMTRDLQSVWARARKAGPWCIVTLPAYGLVCLVDWYRSKRQRGERWGSREHGIDTGYPATDATRGRRK